MFRNVGPDYHGAHLIYTSTGGPKCYSNVGRQDGGGQLVNLGSPGCTYVGVVLHKTLHALGLDFTTAKKFIEFAQVLCMSTWGQTGIFLYQSTTKTSNLKQRPTLPWCTVPARVSGTPHSTPVAWWCMGRMTLESSTVQGDQRSLFNPWRLELIWGHKTWFVQYRLNQSKLIQIFMILSCMIIQGNWNKDGAVFGGQDWTGTCLSAYNRCNNFHTLYFLLR